MSANAELTEAKTSAGSAERKAAAFRKIRLDCYNAVSMSYAEDVSPILDDVFDIATKAIRRHFGIGIQDAELILRDARNEAERLVGRYHLDDLFNLDEVINAIAEYLAEEEQP